MEIVILSTQYYMLTMKVCKISKFPSRRKSHRDDRDWDRKHPRRSDRSPDRHSNCSSPASSLHSEPPFRDGRRDRPDNFHSRSERQRDKYHDHDSGRTSRNRVKTAFG